MSTLLEQASLVLIPSGYKEDTVYSVIPSNGSGDMSFTRASDGTRINSDGLVEVTPWNLFQQSETFENAAWTKNNISVATGIGTTPEGLPYRILTNTVNGFNHLTQTPPLVVNSFYSVTIVLKKGTAISVGFRVGAGTWGDAKYNFDTDAFVGSGVAFASRRFLGDGWIEIKYQNFEALQTNFRVFISSSTTGNSLDGLIGQTLLVSKMQISVGSTAKPYFPTTDRLNVPRLTYQNGGGGCPSLLLEPQRTNLALHSEDFTNVVYTKTNVSATANTTTAPNGIQNADSILELATTSTHESYQRISMTSTQQYTQSCFLKANGRNRVCMQIFDNSTQYASAIYDLSTGVVVSSSGTAKIESMGNGWYRCAITGTSPATGLGYCVLGLCENTYTNSSVMQTYLGDITKGVYWWGFQLEAGAYATSYIPTTTASATRIADGFSRANVYTNGFITASGGTWFVEFTNNLTYTRDNGNNTLILADLLGTNFFRLRNDGSVNTTIRLQKSISGTTTDLFILPTGNVKIAVKWNGTTADAFLNGTKIVSATPFTATQLENLTSVPQVPIFISQMILFPTALSDSNCVTLTTI